MNPRISALWAPATRRIARTERLADKLRFVAGSVITSVGAGVLLSDLIALIPSWG